MTSESCNVGGEKNVLIWNENLVPEVNTVENNEEAETVNAL